MPAPDLPHSQITRLLRELVADSTPWQGMSRVELDQAT
jgi:hypothetical protein